MTHKLEIELPPEVFERIQRDAYALGRTPSEQVAAEVALRADSAGACVDAVISRNLSTRIARTPVDLNDPLEQLFGTLQFDPPDLFENHDKYIADDLAERKLGIPRKP